MIALLTALAVGAYSPPAYQIHIPAVINASGQGLTLGDVIDRDALPAALRGVSGTILLRSGAARSFTFSRADFAARLRHQVPALGPWLDDNEAGAVTIQFTAPESSAVESSDRPCAEVVRSIAADAFVGVADLRSHACGDASRNNAFYYDRSSGFSRARERLQPGTIATAPPATTLTVVQPGQTVAISVKVGPVVVERTVSAAQPIHAGQPMFVTDTTGSVFAAPALDARP